MKRVVLTLALLVLSTGGALSPHYGATIVYGLYLGANTTATPIDCPEPMADIGVCLASKVGLGGMMMEMETALAGLEEWTPAGDWTVDGEGAYRRGVIVQPIGVYALYVFLFREEAGTFVLVTAEEL